MTKENEKLESRIGAWDIFILFLSLYVLTAMFLEVALHLPEGITEVLQILDAFICVIFLGDFFYRLAKAESKLGYLKWGWIDFISSIPTFDALRVGRLFRVVRVLRVLRGVRSTRVFLRVMFRNRAQSTLSTVSIFSVAMVIFAAIAILYVEVYPESNIKTAQDAIWWAMATVTTVGYGDKYPVSVEGQIIAAFLMITGLGLFSTFTGYVSSFFVEEEIEEQDEEDEERDEQVKQRLDRIEALLLELKEKLEHTADKSSHRDPA